MAYDFPNSPTTGQIVTGPGGIQWQWDGVKWVVVNGASPGFAPINNPVFTGDPQAPTPAYGDNDQSIPTTSFVQSAVAPTLHNVGRNLLHNGLFNIQQRGAGPWTTPAYTVDRWTPSFVNDTVTTTVATLTDADRAAIGDETAISALQLAVVGSSTSGSYTELMQPVEAVKRLSNKQITVSFWARASSGTPKIGIGYLQLFGTGGSPSAAAPGNLGVTPALSTTWQRYSYTGTVPSAAGKTFGTTAGTDRTQVEFWLSDQGPGAGRSGGIGVQSGTVQFWGMQLEIGSQATPLEKLDPRLDLANCQRFFQSWTVNLAGQTPPTGNSISQSWGLPVMMRSLPTITITNNGSGGPIGTVSVAALGAGYLYIIAPSTGSSNFVLNANGYASADL